MKIGKGDLSEICCCGMCTMSVRTDKLWRLPTESNCRAPDLLLARMGSSQSVPVQNEPYQNQSQNCPSLVIVALATQWPGHLMTHEDFERYVRRWYNPDENPRSVLSSFKSCGKSALLTNEVLHGS